jgi:hypothetical protein
MKKTRTSAAAAALIAVAGLSHMATSFATPNSAAKAAASQAPAEVVLPFTVDDFRLSDQNLHSHELRQLGDATAIVLITQANNCPVSRNTSAAVKALQDEYKSGAMQALQRYAASHDVVWLSIDTAAPDKAGYLSAAAARARIGQTHATVTAFLFDLDGNIARSYGAKTTPSFFIVDRDGKLAYQGAMDDQVFADERQGRE